MGCWGGGEVGGWGDSQEAQFSVFHINLKLNKLHRDFLYLTIK